MLMIRLHRNNATIESLINFRFFKKENLILPKY